MQRTLMMLAAATLAATPVFAQTSGAAGTSRSDAMTTQTAANNGGKAAAMTLGRFVRAAGQGNLFEIQSSQLALQRSQRQDVRQVAQRLITDHAKAASDLKQALGQSGPQPPQQLDNKHQQLMTKLRNAQGMNFDRTFISEQTQAHQQAIRLFRTYAANGGNAQVKQFAQATLPTLEQHLQIVQDLQRASNATASRDMKTNAGGGGSATKHAR